MHERFNEAFVTLELLCLELIQHSANRLSLIASRIQFSLQFRFAVLTPSQQRERPLPDLLGRFRQASASSATASGVTSGRAFLRISLSILRTVSGCSFMKLRTLSLP